MKFIVKYKKVLFVLYAIAILIALLGAVSCSCSKAKAIEKLSAPQNLKAERRVVTWDAVENATGYKVIFQNTEYDTKECRFELHFFDASGTYKIEVIAVGDGKAYTNSEKAVTDVTVQRKVSRGYDKSGFEYTLLEDGTGYEVSKGKANLAGVITIPEYFGDYPVKRIAEDAFNDQKIANCFTEENCNTSTTGINLPAQLESIGKGAMSDMVRLKEIIIPDSVVEIGEFAFSGCTRLKKAVLPKGLKEIPKQCFLDTALSEIVLPDSLEKIGEAAFMCRTLKDSSSILSMHIDSALSTVVIPSSVTHIEQKAFYGRENLKTVIFEASDNIEWFNGEVFADTLWYESQEDGLVYLDSILYEYKGDMPKDYEIVLPENVTAIAGFAFANKEKLKKITIPNGAKLAGVRIFSFCTSLSEIVLPEDLEIIPEYTFVRTSNLKNISLPSGVLSIGKHAFLQSGIESISIPSTVKEIEMSTFFSCKSLSDVQLSDGLEAIGDDAFANCSALNKINLPKTLKKMGITAFKSTNLESVIIPGSLETLGENPFAYCKAFTSIYYEGDLAKWEKLTVDSFPTDGPVGDTLANVTVYYYSEAKPTEKGDFWHYVDGKPTPWVEES